MLEDHLQGYYKLMEDMMKSWPKAGLLRLWRWKTNIEEGTCLLYTSDAADDIGQV